jgi:Flp pilus assembly pilin Flp
MNKLFVHVIRFVRDEQGQDLVEYTLVLTLICLASVAVFTGAGGSINKVWNSTSTTLLNAVTASS